MTDYEAARKVLLLAEAALMAEIKRVAGLRQALPPGPVMPEYSFTELDGGTGTLADLVGDRQLAVYHMMYAPDWDEGCPSCSMWIDGLNGVAHHLAQTMNLAVIAGEPQQLGAQQLELRHMEAWAGEYRARWPWIFVGALVLLVGQYSIQFGPSLVLAFGALLGAGFVTLTACFVSITSEGVRVRSLTPWPSAHIGPDRIASAEAIDAIPWQWNAWAYRGRRRGWILRSGPALKLNLTDGTMFAVTVDNPDEGAAVLNRLLTSTPP